MPMTDEEFMNLDLSKKVEPEVIPQTMGDVQPDVPTPAAPDGTATVTAEAEVEPMGFVEGFASNYKENTLTGFAARKMAYPEFEPDPSLHVTLKDMEERYADIASDNYSFIADADSLEEMDYRADRVRQRIEDEKRFAAMGTAEQLAIGLGGAVLDIPANLMALAGGALAAPFTGGTSIAAAGAAVSARLGMTGARIAKIVGAGTGAAIGAGTQAAIQESILATDDPLRNSQTMAIAVATGMAFGAVGGGVGKSYTMRKAALRDSSALQQQVIMGTFNTLSNPAPKPVLNSSTAGKILMPEDNVQNAARDDARLYRLGIDMTSSLKRSGDKGFQDLATMFGENAIYGGGRTMAIEKEIVSKSTHNLFLRDYDGAYQEWGKSRGANKLARTFNKDRLQFNYDVAPVVRGISTSADPAINKAAKTTQKFFSKMLEVAKRSGLEGFDDIPENHNYLTRIYSDKQFAAAAGRGLGKDVIVRTIKGAIMAHPDNELPDDIAEKIGAAIYKRTTSFSRVDDRYTTVLTNDIKEELKGYLADAGMTQTDIEETMARLLAKNDESGKPNVAMHRINMDEAYVDAASGLKFTDLLENNVEEIVNTYANRIGGAAAAARFGFTTPRKLQQHIDKLADDAKAAGMPERKVRKYKRIASRMAADILGMPVEDRDGDWIGERQILQALRDYSYINKSGGFLLASLPEMSYAFTQNGVKAAMSAIPVTRKFVKDVMKGIPPDQHIFNVLESLGVGGDRYLSRTFARIDEEDLLGGTAVPNLLRGGKRMASELSGLPLLTQHSQLFAGKAVIQKFTDMALKGNDVEITRHLKMLGFNDKQQLDDVLAGVKAYVKTHKGFLSGNKVVALDLDAWRDADPIAAERFTTAVVRSVNNAIQKNLTGELPELMYNSAFKTVMQFKTFSLAAHGKKTLNGLNRRDVSTAASVITGSAIGTMVYAGRMWALAQTRDDPQGFLEEKLSPEELAKAAFSRSGYFALMPSAIDTLGQFAAQDGYDPVFTSDMRTSGVAYGGLQSIPAMSAPSQVVAGSYGAAEAAVTDAEFQERDARNLVDWMPLRRLPGVNFLLETFINQFPERGKEK